MEITFNSLKYKINSQNLWTRLCEAAARDLCYDAAEGRIVYKAARRYMPQFDGLRPESMSVRGNRVTFKYSYK